MKEIGWNTESNLLQKISKQLTQLTKVTSKNVTPYKVYTALLTQSGTDAPVATVLENTIGDIVWSYNDVGSYYCTITPVPLESKTFYFAQNPSTDIILALTFQTGKIYTAIAFPNPYTATDDYLYNSPFEIRVYP